LFFVDSSLVFSSYDKFSFSKDNQQFLYTFETVKQKFSSISIGISKESLISEKNRFYPISFTNTNETSTLIVFIPVQVSSSVVQPKDSLILFQNHSFNVLLRNFGIIIIPEENLNSSLIANISLDISSSSQSIFNKSIIFEFKQNYPFVFVIESEIVSKLTSDSKIEVSFSHVSVFQSSLIQQQESSFYWETQTSTLQPFPSIPQAKFILKKDGTFLGSFSCLSSCVFNFEEQNFYFGCKNSRITLQKNSQIGEISLRIRMNFINSNFVLFQEEGSFKFTKLY
jgi:hypothetical protein